MLGAIPGILFVGVLKGYLRGVPADLGDLADFSLICLWRLVVKNNFCENYEKAGEVLFNIISESSSMYECTS